MLATDSPAVETRPGDSIPEYIGKRNGDGVILEKVEATFEPGRDRIVAVIPAYNEARFIGSVVLQTLQNACTVIVVDDGSTDLTAPVAQFAGAVVVQHMNNKGYGAAIRTAFAAAILLEKDAVILLDADGQLSLILTWDLDNKKLQVLTENSSPPQPPKILCRTSVQAVEKVSKMKRFLGKIVLEKAFLVWKVHFYVYNLLSNILKG